MHRFGILTVRPARRADGAALCDGLREADRAEIAAAGQTVEAALAHGIGGSDAWAVEDPSGRVLAVFGRRRADDGDSLVWLLAAPGLLRHQKAFLAGARAWLAAWLADSRRLRAIAWPGNAVHQRWLARMGFAVAGTVAMPATGALFNDHHLDRSNHVS